MISENFTNLAEGLTEGWIGSKLVNFAMGNNPVEDLVSAVSKGAGVGNVAPANTFGR